ncbi:hypothetical protein CDD81_2970 [Ophiocordyceps australis]|uniref:Acid phosphatase n=1 Tax=Ophiocordyceps australis TaxID=1399860 RepID=A0A2C5YJU9_9HYPO|nr:hypothetical protein CDD81_2970 [Ophiocordyceps australis]
MPSRLPLVVLLVLVLAALGHAASKERVLGSYIFHRHGDRSAKAWKPVNLTALGAAQVHSSGVFYRDRYLSDSGRFRIAALSRDTAVPAQLSVSSPHDVVLHNSAAAFLQGLYPPTALAAERLANGSRIQAPLNGYQYIPVNGPADSEAAAAALSPLQVEDSAWLQGGSGCSRSQVSSNAYLTSLDYRRDYDDSRAFYQSLLPVINRTYDDAAATFKNAYSIFDLINAASIHNSTIPSSDLVTPAVRSRLYHLASVHEWNLAFNTSQPVRAVAGAVLAVQVLNSLQALVDARPNAPHLNAQFGPYGTFMAFFGLAQLPIVSSDFMGICDYASSMAFELVTSSDAATVAPQDIFVQFSFANGSAADNGLKLFPLFGQDKLALPWLEFKTAMSSFAVADSKHWCDFCGNTGGKCAAYQDSASGASSSSSHDSGVSKPVAGVIGALVTLVVILALQAAVMLIGGLRLVRKSTVQKNSHLSDVSTLKA